MNISNFIKSLFSFLFSFRDTEWFLGQVGELLGKYFDLTMTSVCPDKTIPLFGKHPTIFENRLQIILIKLMYSLDELIVETEKEIKDHCVC